MTVQNPPRVSGRPPLRPALIVVALVLVAFNLRTTVSSLPPLLGEIEREAHLSGVLAGLLTALPVLCMAFLAPGAHRLAHRFGREVVTLVSIALIAAGNGLRVLGSVPLALFGATVVAGVGVAVAGVVIPSLVKDLTRSRAGTVTGAYTVAMMLGAAVASTIAVPLRSALGSWQWSLAAWAAPALLATVAWTAVTLRPAEPGDDNNDGPGRLPWRSRAAWLLAGFLGLQSALAYAYIAWLPPAYEARGWSPASAGVLLGVNFVAQLACAVVAPALADRADDPRRLIAAVVACTVIGAAWLLVVPEVLPWVASCVLGIGLGGGFSLGLAVIVGYAADAGASSRLTALVFLICFTMGAAAPVLVGGLRDLTGGLTVPFALLLALAAGQLLIGTRLSPAYRGTVS